MENGIQLMFDISPLTTYPQQTVGASAHPVRTSPSQDSEKDLAETEVPSFVKYLEFSGRSKKPIDPNGLSTKMLRECLAAIEGGDFAAIILEMEQLGYDIEWQLFNTKNFGVPQNRERVYVVGHLRTRGRKQIFPLKGTDGENSVCEVNQIGMQKSHRTNPNQYRLYDTDGISPCLNKMDGGGLEPHIPVQFGIDKNTQGAEIECANALTAREDRGVSNYKQTGTAVAITMGYDRGLNEITIGAFPTCNARDYKGINFRDLGGVAIPVLTPDRAEKRQNGRRFKDNGDESFTLTAQDRHGVALKVNDKEVYAVWYEKYNCYIAIRKLTPLECFHLQGWTDNYFEKAAFVNSDSQLYKQAGNGVTVDVVQAIAEKLKESESK